jgi:hypothetical protein
MSQAEHSEGKLPEQWIDLSFLQMPTSKYEPKQYFALRKSRFSLVLCGSDNQHWVGYAFGDSGLDEDKLEDLLEDVVSYEGSNLYEDPIASVGARVVDAKRPISDPRVYYLVVFEIRIARVLEDWQILIRFMERGIDKHVC